MLPCPYLTRRPPLSRSASKDLPLQARRLVLQISSFLVVVISRLRFLLPRPVRLSLSYLQRVGILLPKGAGCPRSFASFTFQSGDVEDDGVLFVPVNCNNSAREDFS